MKKKKYKFVIPQLYTDYSQSKPIMSPSSSTWQWIGFLLVLGLASWGAYQLYQQYKALPDSDKHETQRIYMTPDQVSLF